MPDGTSVRLLKSLLSCLRQTLLRLGAHERSWLLEAVHGATVSPPHLRVRLECERSGFVQSSQISLAEAWDRRRRTQPRRHLVASGMLQCGLNLRVEAVPTCVHHFAESVAIDSAECSLPIEQALFSPSHRRAPSFDFKGWTHTMQQCGQERYRSSNAPISLHAARSGQRSAHSRRGAWQVT